MADMISRDLEDLITLRDWLRYATSRFRAAGLSYGHGTATATDEAAYLILHTLHLPIDELEPWLDCRLTAAERAAVGQIVERRVATRKPASYLTNEAWIGPHSFYVDERVIVPRSYIGELLGEQLSAVLAEPEAVRRVLDLCTGSGALAILAAMAFPYAEVDASDLSADALQVAQRNVAEYGLEDRIRLVRSDLFKDLGAAKYDLILANPPYVAAAEIAEFPPEHRAEPLLAHAGGEDGLDVVRSIIDQAKAHLVPGGALVVEIGTGREGLEQAYDLPFLWLDTAESEGEVLALAQEQLP